MTYDALSMTRRGISQKGLEGDVEIACMLFYNEEHTEVCNKKVGNMPTFLLPFRSYGMAGAREKV
ncbi:hypothetical protein CSA56_02585 [candidate division KSB3 bacterium]|uniref:Uncharacterized protein n=1 Tax=candidate division KSB3 bacterium TaxID=2044937 RepID=A0A2G6KJK7_9BACT|nr:MAG: hypothetical protein CSA56_02585 [candidate division KSB3 bacterium]